MNCNSDGVFSVTYKLVLFTAWSVFRYGRIFGCFMLLETQSSLRKEGRGGIE